MEKFEKILLASSIIGTTIIVSNFLYSSFSTNFTLEDCQNKIYFMEKDIQRLQELVSYQFYQLDIIAD